MRPPSSSDCVWVSDACERIGEVNDSYLGTYIRIGKTPRHGPIYRVRRFDRSRRSWTFENIFTGKESTLAAVDLDIAVEEGIAHVVGRVKLDS